MHGPVETRSLSMTCYSLFLPWRTALRGGALAACLLALLLTVTFFDLKYL